MTGLGETKARELIAEGEWQVVRAGRRVLVVVRGLVEWIERNAEGSGTSPSSMIGVQ